MPNVCVVCRKEISEGTPIREDGIIRLIRKVKEKTGTLQNNRLMVCDADLEAYRKKRQSFERSAVLHATGAVLIVAFFIFAPLLLGATFNVINIFFALVLGLMIAALAILGYVPSLDEPGVQTGIGGFRLPFAPAPKEEKKTPEEIARRIGAAKAAPAPKRKAKGKR